MPTEKGWAIIGSCGLYVGWYQTRASMIAHHVHDTWTGASEPPHQFALSGKLNPLQQYGWRQCQKRGDRAVRVSITYKTE